MPSDFELRLRAFAEIIVRVGLNLQPGQRLLITEPYELQGVARGSRNLVDAVHTAAKAACPGPGAPEVIWAEEARLRNLAGLADWRGFTRLVAGNAAKMEEYLRRGDALLFLQGSQPDLLDRIAAENVAEIRRIAWEHFGPVAQQLVAGATNWSVAPAPSTPWADAAYAELPADLRLPVLWEDVFQACRVGPDPDPARHQAQTVHGPTEAALAAWRIHLHALQTRCEELNASRIKLLRYQGKGTDLTVTLPSEHVWCTAQLKTKSGLLFVANLPTEEVFTAPHKDSAEGVVQVSGAVSYGGRIIDGIELEFKCGRVVRAVADAGEDMLKRLLDTDEGASRLGEVALVPYDSPLASSSRLFYHPLLDENASNHIALGEGYAFCLRPPNPSAINRSLLHVDLPLNARASMQS